MRRVWILVLSILTFAFTLCGCNQLKDVMTEIVGVRTETSYTNEFLQISYTQPHGWRFFSDEEIDQTMGTNDDVLSAILLDYEFMAIDEYRQNNIVLGIERLLGAKDITVEQYVEKLKEQMPGYSFGELTEVELNDVAYLRLDARYSASIKQYIYLRKRGSRMVLIIATTANGMSAKSFEKLFSPAMKGEPSEDLQYQLSEDERSYLVTGKGNCLDSHIVVPETYNSLPVTGINEFAFYNCKELEGIALANGITHIGETPSCVVKA